MHDPTIVHLLPLSPLESTEPYFAPPQRKAWLRAWSLALTKGTKVKYSCAVSLSSEYFYGCEVFSGVTSIGVWYKHACMSAGHKFLFNEL